MPTTMTIIIQRLGTDRILVQLPGFTDIDAAKGLVEQTGFLEFRQVELNSGNTVTLADYLARSSPGFFDTKEQGNRIFVDSKSNPVVFITKSGTTLKYADADGKALDPANLSQYGSALAWIPSRGDDGTPLTGGLLAEAKPDLQTATKGAQAQVDIKWNAQGATVFDQVARRIYNSGQYGSPQRALGIFLDNRLISDPQILNPSYGGSAVITGNFTVAEVQRLASLLQSGALPVPLVKPPLFQQKVSPSLKSRSAMNLKSSSLRR
jgi:preprotein translocase subunit SecD